MFRHLATIVLVVGLTVAAHAHAGQPRVFAAPEVTPAHPEYIPAYNGTSLPDTTPKAQTQTQTLSFMLTVLLFLGLILFFAPMFIACHRDHPNAVPITIVNVFLGWTLVGWVIALAWACNATAPRFPQVAPPIAPTMVAPTPATMDYY